MKIKNIKTLVMAGRYKILILIATISLSTSAMAQQGGYSLKFTGSAGNYVNLGSSTFNFGNNSFTIEAWFRSSMSSDDQSIIGKNAWCNYTGYYLRVEHTGKLRAVIVANNLTICDDPTKVVNLNGTTMVADEKWHHAAMVVDRTGGHLTVTVYLDGKSEMSGTNTNVVANDLINNVDNLCIGATHAYADPGPSYIPGGVYGTFFNGTIDELRVWTYARTQAEIKANMYKEIPAQPNLLAYYKMSDGSGSTLTDNSGNSYNGTLVNLPTWNASGCFAGPGRTLDFDGVNDYVNVPYSSSLDMSNSLTIEAWIKPVSESPWYTFVMKGNYGYGLALTGSQSGACTETTQSRQLAFWVDNHCYNTVRSSLAYSGGIWQHVAVTVNDVGSQLEICFYLNGKKDGPYYSNFSSISNGGSSSAMIIGCQGTGCIGCGSLGGQLDELRIWNVVRSSAEIRDNMMANLSGNESGLKAYYRFDQSDGSILYDMTSNGNIGTLVNMDPATDWQPSSAFNTWIGSESSDWSTAANWSSGAVASSTDNVGLYKWNTLSYESAVSGTPSVRNLLVSSGSSPAFSSALTASGTVIFNGSAALYGNSTINSFASAVIASGKVLTIPYDGRLTVTGSLINDAGNSGLVIQSNASGTGSLIQSSSGVGATVQRYITGSNSLTNYQYHLVSIPINYTSPTSNLFLGSYLYKLDATQTDPSNNNYYGKWVNLGSSTTTPLLCNSGYMIYYPAAAITYTFAGNLNSGTFNPAVSYGGNYSFNLVPNPFSSAIDWGVASGWTKTNIGPTAWVWPAGGGNYTIISTSTNRYIPAGQAFIVMSSAANPVLSMTNGVCVHSGQSFYKSGLAGELKITAQSNGYTDETYLHINPMATNEFDPVLDGFKLWGLEDAPQLWTEKGEYRLSYQELPAPDPGLVVPLDFKAAWSGQVTLNIDGSDSFDPWMPIKLQDHVTGLVTDLRQSGSYMFSHDSSNTEKRFSLIFGFPQGVNDAGMSDGLIQISGSSVIINPCVLQGKEAELEIFNMLGQKLSTRQIMLDKIIRINPCVKGMIIARLTAGDKVCTARGYIN